MVTESDRANALGYAAAMTRAHAARGPEAWYRAALPFAGIAPPSEAERHAIDDRRIAAVDAANKDVVASLVHAIGTLPPADQSVVLRRFVTSFDALGQAVSSER